MLGKKYKMLKVNKNKRGGYATKRDFHRDRVNGYVSKRELYNLMHAYLRGLES